METNSLIKNEYRAMINKLNLSNRQRNERTQEYFFIDSADSELKLFSAVSQSQKLLLCVANKRKMWFAANDEFQDLAKFLAWTMRHYNGQDDLTHFIKSHVFKLPDKF